MSNRVFKIEIERKSFHQYTGGAFIKREYRGCYHEIKFEWSMIEEKNNKVERLYPFTVTTCIDPDRLLAPCVEIEFDSGNFPYYTTESITEIRKEVERRDYLVEYSFLRKVKNAFNAALNELK